MQVTATFNHPDQPYMMELKFEVLHAPVEDLRGAYDAAEAFAKSLSDWNLVETLIDPF